jgi:hypothetical protein
MKHMKKTMIVIAALAALYASCVKPDVPDPLTPPGTSPGTGTQQPDTPIVPALTQYECVTAEYLIDTATIAGTLFVPDALVYINARVPHDIGRGYDSMMRYAMHDYPPGDMTGYYIMLQYRIEIVAYTDAILQRDYPHLYAFRVERGAYPHGDSLRHPQITYCNEVDRAQVAQQ